MNIFLTLMLGLVLGELALAVPFAIYLLGRIAAAAERQERRP